MTSCMEKSLPRTLHGGSFRYWQIIDRRSFSRNEEMYYYFDKYGKYVIFIYRRNNLHEYNSGDELYTPVWKWNDSILTIGDCEYYIQEIKNNRILIKYMLFNIMETDTLEALPYVKVPMHARHYYRGNKKCYPEAIR